jgi:ABC-type dipeptide/oligopeptide/nickel transport system permease component
MPSFWMGALFIIIFSAKLGWLPSSGYYGFSYLILPSLSLGLVVAGVLIKMTEKLVREEQKKDYVRTLRAKGLNENTIFYKHILRNALIPILTVAGMQLGYLLSGSVVIESLFAIPGLGDLALSAIRTRDLPVLQAVILITALFFILLNQIVDLLYAVIDPRVSKT